MASPDEALRVEAGRPQPGKADRGVITSSVPAARAGRTAPPPVRLGTLAAALVIVVCAVAFGQIKLNVERFVPGHARASHLRELGGDSADSS
jgi:hypothetical protein